MREIYIEKYFVNEVRKAGGKAYKFTSPGHRSVPDRIVLLPGGVVKFVELKAPGKGPTIPQEREHVRLRRMGFQVDVLDHTKRVDEWVRREMG